MQWQDVRQVLYGFVVLVVLAGTFAMLGCGGDDAFEPFEGRDTTPADLENRSFTFSFVSNGGPFDPSLGDAPTTLTFEQFDVTNTAPFTLQARGATVTGNATLIQSVFTLIFLQVDPALPFTENQEVQLEAQTDIDDGRLSVANTATGLETTSEPT